MRSLLNDELARLGPLASPLGELLEPTQTSGDEMFNWLMRSVHIPADDLGRLAGQRVAFIGDAAHAMPIFAGEGGNHAMLDGVELGRSLADLRADPPAAVAAFYRGAHSRWAEAVAGSERRLLGLTRPIAEWRALARRAQREVG
jgi:monooxygenase